MQVGDAGVRDGKILTERPLRAPPPDRPSRPEGAAERAHEERSPFARILHGLGAEVDRGEALVRRVSAGPYGGGKELGNLELLSLQAGIYRYSEAVDLAAKLVDRAASGIKTVLQGQ